MSQRSITSFFKQITPPESSPENGSSKRSKRPRRISSSEDEEEESAKKVKNLQKEQIDRPKIKISMSPQGKAKKLTEAKQISPNVKTEVVKTKSLETKQMNGKPQVKTEPKLSESKQTKENIFGKSQVKNEEVKAEYNPNLSKYHPIQDATWTQGSRVPYSALASTLGAIEEVSARLKMIEILSNFFRSVMVLTPEDMLPSVYLCLNKIAPAYEGYYMASCFSFYSIYKDKHNKS